MLGLRDDVVNLAQRESSGQAAVRLLQSLGGVRLGTRAPPRSIDGGRCRLGGYDTSHVPQHRRSTTLGRVAEHGGGQRR